MTSQYSHDVNNDQQVMNILVTLACVLVVCCCCVILIMLVKARKDRMKSEKKSDSITKGIVMMKHKQIKSVSMDENRKGVLVEIIE